MTNRHIPKRITMPANDFKSTVEIFRTDVPDTAVAGKVVSVLNDHFPEAHINFDLEDCDRILRVEGPYVNIKKVEDILHSLHIHAEVLF